MYRLILVALVFLVVLVQAGAGVVMAQEADPAVPQTCHDRDCIDDPIVIECGTAVVDGVADQGVFGDGTLWVEWDQRFFITELRQAGKPDKPVIGYLMLQHDEPRNVLYGLVHTVPKVFINTGAAVGEHFAKVNGVKAVDNGTGNDGTAPDFAYLGTQGFEFSINLDDRPIPYSLPGAGFEAHGLYFGESSNETFATLEGLRVMLKHCPTGIRLDSFKAETVYPSIFEMIGGWLQSAFSLVTG